MTEQNTLAAVSDSLADAVERVAASVVTVGARRRIPATGVVWRRDGLIVTADHVVEREEEIRVRLPGAEEPVAAELVGRDPSSDLALLRVEAELTPAELTPEDEARIGQLVLAVGRPGASSEASLGVLGGVGGWRRRGRGHRGHSGHHGNSSYLRSDVTMFPGFSGGPLIDAEGRVLGINTSGFRHASGITIPSATVSEVVETLAQHGRIRRAYLGIGSQVTRLPEAQTAKLDGELAGLESGLLVVSIEDDSPGAAGGLLVGDILVGIEGSPLGRTEDLQEQLGSERVGVAVDLTLLRGGEPAMVSVTPTERP
ncbi:MAG: PDZ domain-containing protein [Dehalococcoidia bacterium]|nr:PDZ domain-containing protein [Dehalococcoidia bacterium]